MNIRPSVSKAVLQIALWLIKQVNHTFFSNHLKLLHSQTGRARTWNSEIMFTSYHLSNVMCHMSDLRCQIACGRCQMACVRCQVSCVFLFFFKVFELVSGGSVINIAYPIYIFSKNWPVGQFFHRVAMSVYIYICLSVCPLFLPQLYSATTPKRLEICVPFMK